MRRHVIKERSASSSPNIRKPQESDLYSLIEFEKEPTAACRAASIRINTWKETAESPQLPTHAWISLVHCAWQRLGRRNGLLWKSPQPPLFFGKKHWWAAKIAVGGGDVIYSWAFARSRWSFEHLWAVKIVVLDSYLKDGTTIEVMSHKFWFRCRAGWEV